MQTLLGQHLSILRCMHVYKTYQENDGRHRSMTSLVNHGKYFRHVTIASWHKHQPMDTADSQWAKCTTWWWLINCKVQILHWSILPFSPCQKPPQHLNFWSVQMLDKHFFPSITCTGHKAAYRCYCLLEWNFFTVALTCSIHLQKLKKKEHLTYLAPLNASPFTQPKVEHATKIGINQATGPIFSSPTTCTLNQHVI